MAPEIIGIIGLVILFVLLALGMPIAFSMILIALGGLTVLSGIICSRMVQLSDTGEHHGECSVFTHTTLVALVPNVSPFNSNHFSMSSVSYSSSKCSS